MAISIITMAPISAKAQGPGDFYVIYEGYITIPSVSKANFYLYPSPYAVEVRCTGGMGSWVGMIVDDGGEQNHGEGCYDTYYTTRNNLSGHNLIIYFYNSTGASITRWIQIKAADQINWPTTTPTMWGGATTTPGTATPTPTPGGPTSTPTPTNAPGGGGGITCGDTEENACYVIFPTSGSGGGIGGGGGGGGSGGGWQPGTTVPVEITNASTAGPVEQTAVSLAGMAGSPAGAEPVPFTVIRGPQALVPEAITENEDTFTSSFITSLYDFGCPLDIDSYGLYVHVCITYEYVESISIVGVPIPLGAISTFSLVMVIIYIIRKR